MSRKKPDTNEQPKKGLTKPQVAFIAAYGESGNVSDAARAAKVNRTNHYEWLEKDGDGAYSSAFEEADAKAIDVLEAEARRRAVGGTLEPVYYQGELVGNVRKYSDTLLIFLMKGNNPTKYRDRLTMDGGLNLNHSGQIRITERVMSKRQAVVDAFNENGSDGDRNGN